jgi:glycosyltransferase involved in cell wall biosynthesis
VAAEGPHVAYLVSERDNGIYDAMNKGLALATGEVVGFLNSDDVFAGVDVVSTIAQAMADPMIDACYGNLVYVAPDNMNKVVRYWKSREYELGLCARGWMPDYLTLRHQSDLSPVKLPSHAPMVVLGAARLGKTRLIDNLVV